jgi:carboxypeptidase C (cathepsin A)
MAASGCSFTPGTLCVFPAILGVLLLTARMQDMMCNFMGNERWLEVFDSSFQSEFVAAQSIPWVTAGSGKLAGAVRSAGGKGFTAGNVTFVTVFEAGYVLCFHPSCMAHLRFSGTWSLSINRRRRW